MEYKIRALIVPLCDRLINHLTRSLESAKAEHLTLFALEVLVAKLLAELACELLAGVLGVLFEGRQKSPIACLQCQQTMPVHGYASRSLISLFGSFTVRRAFYYCRACQQRRTPLDEQLALGRRQTSPRLQRLVAFLAAHLSFSTVEKTLREAFAVELSAEALRQIAEEVGDECRAWEENQRQHFEQREPDKAPLRAAPKTWVIEVDGKLVGFQEGGFQEVKVGVIYEVTQRVETRLGRQELLKREIVARRCGWQEFASQFWAAMQRAGIQGGDRLVAIADGAHAMEQIFAFVAPQATRIRDFYHVAERIQAIAEVRYGEASATGQQWARVQLAKLKESEVAKVIHSIKHLKLATKTAEETRRQVLGYLHNHAEAMDYRRYREEGLPIGSGAVEGGCRLIGARTNGCGRRWSESGCDAIVALRVAVLNDRLQQIRPQPQLPLKSAV